jgi:alpha-1,6-mannosyltransferase
MSRREGTARISANLWGKAKVSILADDIKENDLLTPHFRAWLLALVGMLSVLAYWVLVAISLNPKLTLVYNVKGATYGGLLVWPSRWLHLAGISAESRMWLFIYLVVALNVLWLAAIYLVRQDRRKSVTFIIAGAFALFALLFVFGPPFQSRDVYSYVFFGRSMTVYHSNPFLLVPHARPHDVFYPLVGWKFNASVYGPVFNYPAYLITKIAGNNIAANVLGFKMLSFVSYAACLPLVYWLTRRVSPGRENMALVITGWSPIIVMHLLGGGHIDAMMIALLLGGYLLYRKGYLLSGIALVMVASMVKIVALLAVAPMIVMYVRDRRGAPLKRLVKAGVVVAGVPVLLYLPFLHSLKIFSTTSHMSKLYSSSSIPRLVSFEYQKILRHAGMSHVKADTIANARVHWLFIGIFAVLTIVVLLRVKDYRTMVVSASAIFLLWFLTSSYILPWYLVMGLMLTAIVGWNFTTAAMLGASVIFSFYRIPEVPRSGGGGGPNFYLCVPLLLLFTGWLVVEGVRRLMAWHAGRASAGPVDELDLVLPDE